MDCNNFFVSCERAFQPQLEGRPVVVLSNNDGCVVARSNESKAMGIKMGTPFFKVRALVDSGALEVRSSNYTLYGDLSSRVMSILRDFAPKLEVYSIDEAFLVMDGIPLERLKAIAGEIIRRVRRWVGIPVSVGIAPTRTLAKVANHFAKRYSGYRGVCVIDTDEKREKALALTPIDDVWGIGWRNAPKLERVGVHTAADFTARPQEWVRTLMGVIGVRTWMELRGTPVIGEEERERRQTICTSRSFADMITEPEELSLRVSDFAAICARKLRDEGSVAGTIGVFLMSNRFRDDLEQYFPQDLEHFDIPTSNTPEIVAASLKIMKRIYREGIRYKKAGVIVMDIQDARFVQPDLFDAKKEERLRNDRISRIMDQVNVTGRQYLRLAVQRPGHYADGIRMEHRSGRFSTDWSELMEIH
ncbi:MAG: DUF4113 domain-containing protein [Bacteroidales bacterium]|nr:DUF4113 domain-containing protein [Bacteroidales bacterium]